MVFTSIIRERVNEKRMIRHLVGCIEQVQAFAGASALRQLDEVQRQLAAKVARRVSYLKTANDIYTNVTHGDPNVTHSKELSTHRPSW